MKILLLGPGHTTTVSRHMFLTSVLQSMLKVPVLSDSLRPQFLVSHENHTHMHKTHTPSFQDSQQYGTHIMQRVHEKYIKYA